MDVCVDAMMIENEGVSHSKAHIMVYECSLNGETNNIRVQLVCFFLYKILFEQCQGDTKNIIQATQCDS